jgi:hypothetical protein
VSVAVPDKISGLRRDDPVGVHVHNVRAFRTRCAHVFAKGIFFDTDGIPLLVTFFCDSEGTMFQNQVSKLLSGGVSWADAPPEEDYFISKKHFIERGF